MMIYRTGKQPTGRVKGRGI